MHLLFVDNIGVVAVQSGHRLKQLDTSPQLACEHCMVADHALCDVWVSGVGLTTYTLCVVKNMQLLKTISVIFHGQFL